MTKGSISKKKKLTNKAQGFSSCLIASVEELIHSNEQSLVPNVLLISVKILVALQKKWMACKTLIKTIPMSASGPLIETILRKKDVL